MRSARVWNMPRSLASCRNIKRRSRRGSGVCHCEGRTMVWENKSGLAGERTSGSVGACRMW